MKNGVLKTLVCGLWLAYPCAWAQSESAPATDSILQVSRYTVMQQYAPDLVLSAEERIRLKEIRISRVRRREAVIDTLDIPRWKKRKLLRELYRTPFSEQWDKVITSLEPEPDPE